jgi:hypothetical protein
MWILALVSVDDPQRGSTNWAEEDLTHSDAARSMETYREPALSCSRRGCIGDCSLGRA